MLTARRIEIFKAIVDEFINTAEPVGSKALMTKYNLPYSSATIRNDMVALEEMGYLEKPHTSAGRVPSTKGYQFYCEHLLEKKVDNNIKYAISSIFKSNALSIDDAIKRSCDIISEMTNLTAGVLGADARNLTLEHIKLFSIDNSQAVCVFVANNGHTESKNFDLSGDIFNDLETCVDILNERLKGTKINELYDRLNSIRPILTESVTRHEMLFNAFASAFVRFASENVYFSGNNIIYQPEYVDVEKLKKLTKLLADDSIWNQIRDGKYELQVNDPDGTKVTWIDDDVAILSNKVKIGKNEEASIMVVGPSRMQYDKIAGLLHYVSEEVDKAFGDK